MYANTHTSWESWITYKHTSSPWIWKGVSATSQSGRYTLSYPSGRHVCKHTYIILPLAFNVPVHVLMWVKITRWIVTFQVTIIFGLGFLSFCDGPFEFGWVIFIMTDWLKFRVRVFWQPFWTVILDFGLQALNFRSSHRAFAVLNRYIFVCQMESHSVCTVHTLTSLSWFNGVSLSATLAQH